MLFYWLLVYALRWVGCVVVICFDAVDMFDCGFDYGGLGVAYGLVVALLCWVVDLLRRLHCSFGTLVNLSGLLLLLCCCVVGLLVLGFDFSCVG